MSKANRLTDGTLVKEIDYRGYHLHMSKINKPHAKWYGEPSHKLPGFVRESDSAANMESAFKFWVRQIPRRYKISRPSTQHRRPETQPPEHVSQASEDKRQASCPAP